jgi:hypothetical protein
MPIDREKYIALPLMTVGETARYMGVGRKIVYHLIEYGEIRAVKNKVVWRSKKPVLMPSGPPVG